MIMPYLNFSGNCEEAFEFYAKVFSGTIRHMAKYSDAPAEAGFALEEHQRDWVMHAQVQLTEAGGLSGTDALFPTERGGAVHLHAHLPSMKEAEAAFAALAQGGDPVSPLAVNPPPDASGASGMVRDQFGFTWILSAVLD